LPTTPANVNGKLQAYIPYGEHGEVTAPSAADTVVSQKVIDLL